MSHLKITHLELPDHRQREPFSRTVILSTDNSRGSTESERSSQEDTNTSPPATKTKAEIRVREEASPVDEDAEITDDDTMVRVMWTVDRSEEFFNKGIVSKLGGFRKRPLMPETRVAMADIQAFSEIYRLFQIHKF
ncbi:hypothetical protein KY289_023567 [Solanum tuberosum]|nr:hypothetical protein KY289_023567 [Solanum tuberosum]